MRGRCSSTRTHDPQSRTARTSIHTRLLTRHEISRLARSRERRSPVTTRDRDESALARPLRCQGPSGRARGRATPNQETPMHVDTETVNHRRYEKAIETSKRVRWEIDRDVIRGRQFDLTTSFLPDGLTRMGE